MAREPLSAGCVAVGLVLLAGCYKPNISDGGFKCAAGEKPCPDGFACSDLDRRCYLMPPTGIDAGTCMTPIAALCAIEPMTGDACEPACQVGCDCARCNVDPDGMAICGGLGGTKALGAVCTPGAGDDCAPGFLCMKEKCGTNLGRCYRHCATDAQCSGRFCQLRILDRSGNLTKFQVCEIAPSDCDALAGTGCPNAALKCYLSGTQTLCDCPSGSTPAPVMLNEPCVFNNDCATGLVCISNVGGLPGPHCHPVCALATGMCPMGRHCVASSVKYGYCDTNL
jgi:hypothetical protein